MKTTIISLLIILLCQILPAQTKTEIYYGEAGRNDYAKDIIEMYDKGYYVTGGIEGEKGWNIKTDINLEILWDKIFESSDFYVHSRATVADSLGNHYLCGSILGWPFVTKLDSCGDKVWCKILQYDNEFDYGWTEDIIITKNNEIVVLTYYSSDEGIEQIHLIALNEDGDVLWKKPYASRNDYSWLRIPIGNSIKSYYGAYYVTGSCYWPYPDDTNHFFQRPLFISIDSLFEEQWIIPFGVSDFIVGKGFSCIAINDSIYMGVGMRRLEGNEESGLLMFFDNLGNELGYKEITKEQIGSDVSQIYFLDIERTNDSLFIVTAPIGYNNIDFPSAELIVDTAANIYNYSIHNGTKGFSHITKTYDDNFVIATGFEEVGDDDIYVYKIDENLNDVPFDTIPHNYDSLCPGGIQSGNTDLSDCLVWTNIGDAPSPHEYYERIKQIPIRAYPNPVSDGNITFGFENTEHHHDMELRCFDLYGKETLTKKVYRYQTEAVVDITKLKQGMYLAVVYSNGFPVGECKFVVQ